MKKLGKSASSDVSEFKQTILYSYIAQNNPEELENLHKYYGVEDLKEEDMDNVKTYLQEQALENMQLT